MDGTDEVNQKHSRVRAIRSRSATPDKRAGELAKGCEGASERVACRRSGAVEYVVDVDGRGEVMRWAELERGREGRWRAAEGSSVECRVRMC